MRGGGLSDRSVSGTDRAGSSPPRRRVCGWKREENAEPAVTVGVKKRGTGRTTGRMRHISEVKQTLAVTLQTEWKSRAVLKAVLKSQDEW